jgi:tetratricopeptide (TPR) repeat protein/predicted Ser/Thr protein kinase
MSEQRSSRVEELFREALERPPEEREDFVIRASGGDATVRDEVLSLLHHHAMGHGFLSTPAVEEAFGSRPGPRRGVADDAAGATHLPPRQRIGTYTIIDVLGGGGMGVVYLAEQENPRRKVALKVLRTGLATPAMLRRFEHEAELLGRLHHPGIAQVYEAGTADTGEGAQPFFAMEYIEGRPLLEHADARKLGTRERLDLLARICDAVHAAHQNGVIHRDLKPGNILVDAGGQPKVLDFGVARATDSDIQATTLRTDIGQLIGTVPYMSPEQAAGDPAALDLRSDVYALGVLAYELLAGRLPYDLRNKLIHEAVRVIRETDPTPLSSVNRIFRGDVETIVARALEKEKARRYQSASELGADIRRYLNDEPIAARPPSAIYQARKFVRRHRALVGGIAAVFVALVAGLLATFREWLRAEGLLADQIRLTDEVRDQTARAEEALAQQIVLTDKATTETAKAERVLSVLLDILGSPDPTVQGREVKVVDVLQRSAEVIDRELVDQPEVRAWLHARLGKVYMMMGVLDAAEPHLRTALEIREKTLPAEHWDIATNLSDLARLLKQMERLEEAEPLYRRALAMAPTVYGPDHNNNAIIACNLASVLEALDRKDEAEALVREALALQVRTLGASNSETLITQNSLADLLMGQGRIEEAAELLRQGVAGCREQLGATSPFTLSAMLRLAEAYRRLERLDEAEPLIREAVAGFEHTFGPENVYTMRALFNLGSLLNMRDPVAAEPILRRTLEFSLTSPAAPPLERGTRQIALGSCMLKQNRLDEAESLLVEGRRTVEAAHAPDHALCRRATELLGDVERLRALPSPPPEPAPVPPVPGAQGPPPS